MQLCRHFCTKPTVPSSSVAVGLVFPGQGAQHIGMGHSLYTNFPAAKDIFDQVDAVLKLNLSAMMFHGDAHDLRKTSNAQPAILAHSLATLAVLKSESDVFDRTRVVMGHSLGEFTAACAAGYLDLDDGIQLVRARGVAMEAAALQAGDTRMVAMMPLSYEKAQLLCERVRRTMSDCPKGTPICEIANWNATNQIVLSGHAPAVELAIELSKEEFRVRRAVPLDVGAPFHCSLMQSAETTVASLLTNTTAARRPPPAAVAAAAVCGEGGDGDGASGPRSSIQMITNVNGHLQDNWQTIQQDLTQQTCATVKWVSCMETAIHQTEVETWCEVGPGVTLTNLMKRAMPQHYHCFSVGEESCTKDLLAQEKSMRKQKNVFPRGR